MEEKETKQPAENVVTATPQQVAAPSVDINEIENRFARIEELLTAEREQNSALRKQLEEVGKNAKSGITEASQLKSKLSEALGISQEPEALTPEDIFKQYEAKFEEKLNSEVGKLSSKLKEANKTISELHDARLSEVRKRIIAENNGEIVGGMLRGNNEAEILASVDSAKQAFSEIASRFVEQQDSAVKEVKQQTQLPNTSAVASGNVQGSKSKTVEEQIQELVNMPDEDFLNPETNQLVNQLLQGGF